MNKTHISLNVKDLAAALDFYRSFLKAEPDKVRPGYANFDLDNPPLKLALNQAGQSAVSHLGIQVTDAEIVSREIERLKAAGLVTITETDTNCCHAIQDKVWVADPDGHRWEVFVVKADAPQGRPEPDLAGRACCASSSDMSRSRSAGSFRRNRQ